MHDRTFKMQLLLALCAGIGPDKRLSDSFSDAFVRVMPFLRMYVMYCKGYWQALDIVRRESEGSKLFQGFLRFSALKPEVRKLDLGSFLIKPVQRICKYPLFFKDLL
jgi:hypothetical protein